MGPNGARPSACGGGHAWATPGLGRRRTPAMGRCCPLGEGALRFAGCFQKCIFLKIILRTFKIIKKQTGANLTWAPKQSAFAPRWACTPPGGRGPVERGTWAAPPCPQPSPGQSLVCCCPTGATCGSQRLHCPQACLRQQEEVLFTLGREAHPPAAAQPASSTGLGWCRAPWAQGGLAGAELGRGAGHPGLVTPWLVLRGPSVGPEPAGPILLGVSGVLTGPQFD